MDESLWMKLCLMESDDSPLLETFLLLVIGLLVNIYLLFFCVFTEDLEIRMKLLYFSATYLFHSKVFLYSEGSAESLPRETKELAPLPAPIVLLPNLG